MLWMALHCYLTLLAVTLLRYKFFHLVSQYPASGFGVSSSRAAHTHTHTHRGTLCPAKALHSLARGYKAPEGCRGTCRQSMGAHAKPLGAGSSVGLSCSNLHPKCLTAEALSPYLQTLLGHMLP